MHTAMKVMMNKINEDRENEEIIKIKEYIRDKQDHIKWLEQQIIKYENDVVKTNTELRKFLDMSIEEASEFIEDNIEIDIFLNKLLNK